MERFKIKDTYITLGQFIKVHALVDSGGMVKSFLEENRIQLNGVSESRRGRKIYPGDMLSINGVDYFFHD